MPTRKDKTNVTPIYREQVFIPASGATLIKQQARPKIAGRPVSSGVIETVSPEFDLLTGIRGIANLPKGFLKTNKLPQGENLYYRQLDKSSKGLERAKQVGVIDTKSAPPTAITLSSGKTIRIGKTFNTPFFAKGHLWYDKVDDMDVIVGKNNPLLDWKTITKGGGVTKPTPLNTRRTPFYMGESNQAPTELFELYRRYPGIGYRNVTYGFPTIPITGLNTVAEQMKCGGGRKAQLGLAVTDGGTLIPIGKNMFLAQGRTHDDGGIGISYGKKYNAGGDLEIENKEILQVVGGNTKFVGNSKFKSGGQSASLRVFSSVPFLQGVSPAELVMGGANPDTVFKAQEDFKDRNRINDDGTRYQNGGNKVIKYENLPSSFKGKRVNGRILQGGVPPILSRGELAMGNPIQRMSMWTDDIGEFSKYIGKSIHKYIPKKLDLSYRYIADYFSNKGPNNAINNNAENLTKAVSLFNAHEYKTGGIYIKPSKRGTFTAAAKKRGMGVQEFARNASRWKKELGGRIKAEIGTYQPKRNNKGQIVLNPNNPDDVKWLREQQGKRGAKAVHKGQQEFLEGALNRTTPLMLGVAVANPITTATSLAGGYLLGKVGELGGELYKGLTGEDYSREGKVIGQTIGSLGGPIGAKLFGKGATNAWNAYKSNRLNSTQTLINVPESGLTIRPNVQINRPKQLDVTNNQKYLPTDVEDLTWKEPKALLETQAQVTKRDLKNFNRWAKLFGYEPVPLRYAETKSIADRHVQDRIRQHNTFLRGVAKPNKLQKQAIEYELAKEGITNLTDYDVYTYMATHSAPTTGAGRADLRPIQVRKRKVGNFNLSKTSDSPIGALYTQGSGRGAAGYAGMGPESGGHRRTGVVVEVARPTNFRPEASYAEWVKENDFNFGDIRSKGFHKKVANRVAETGKAPEDYNLSAEDKQILFNEIKNEFAARPEPVYETAKHALDYIKNHRPNILKNITQLDESAFNSLSNDSKRAYNEYLGKLMISNPKTVSFNKEVKKEHDRFKNIYRSAVISEGKRHKNKYLSDIDYNPEDYTQPDYSVLKSTSRNKGNAQQHYIFRAPIGEKILEGRGFYLPTEEEIINATTDHYSLWTPGYSRNTRKFGGIKKFKFGGNMIYEINGNVKNGLMSARPKAQYGKQRKVEGYGNTIVIGDDTFMLDEDGIYVPVGNVQIDKQPKTVRGASGRRDIAYDRQGNRYQRRSDGSLIRVSPEKGNIAVSDTIRGVEVNAPDVTKTRSRKQINAATKINNVNANPPRQKVEPNFEIGDQTVVNFLRNSNGKYNTQRTPIHSFTPAQKLGLSSYGWSTYDDPNKGYSFREDAAAVRAGQKSVDEIIGQDLSQINFDDNQSSSTPRRGEIKSASSKTTKPQSTLQDYKNNTPKIDLSKAKMPIFDVGQLGSKETKTAKAKLNTSSTGGGKQSGDGRWIPQFNPITTRDWIGLGSNLAGHIASYFTNNALLSKYPTPVKPVMAQAAKLKTTHNINPELTNNREVELINRGVVRRNTQSSNTSIAREQRIMNEARNARNQLYGRKENIETQLINQDRLNRQSVYQRNVAAYNDWLDKTFVAKNNKLLAKQQNMMNLISGIPMAVNNIIGNIESRQATNNTIKAIAAANPNVDGRLLSIGDYYTQRLGDGRVAIYDKKGKLKKYV